LKDGFLATDRAILNGMLWIKPPCHIFSRISLIRRLF
jgi:hypothetical protein